MKFHYISPYSSDSPPKIGDAINKAVRRIDPHNDDWIIHLDQDACFLLPKDKAKFEQALSECDYQVVGTLTNRLNPVICKEQVVPSLYNEYDVRKHVEYASSIQSGEFKDCHVVALACMAFKASYWRFTDGFDNTPQLDINFSRGAKTAIYTGVYVFHVYRMLNGVKDITHLIK